MTNLPVRHFLRPGHLKMERETFVRTRPAYQGLILNAPILVDGPAVADFLQAIDLPTPFLVDPRTYALATSRGDLQDPTTSKIKRSWVKLLKSYGIDEKDLPLSPEGTKRYGYALVERTLEFEWSSVPAQRQIFLWGGSYLHEPFAFIAPYFAVMADQDPWVSLNLQLARESKVVAGQRAVYAVLQLRRPLLSLEDQMASIARQYSALPIDGFLIWVEGFREEEASVGEVSQLKKLIRTLQSAGTRPIISMYGGYLSALLHQFGLSGFCHRPDGGESRNFTPVGGGPIDTKYYLPALHRHYSVDKVEGYLKRRSIDTPKIFHSVICDCAVCQSVMREGMDGFTQNYAARTIINGKLQATSWAKTLASYHFMLTRYHEVQKTAEIEQEALIHGLLSSASSYADPVVISPEVDTNHLVRWARGLRDN